MVVIIIVLIKYSKFKHSINLLQQKLYCVRRNLYHSIDNSKNPPLYLSVSIILVVMISLYILFLNI